MFEIHSLTPFYKKKKKCGKNISNHFKNRFSEKSLTFIVKHIKAQEAFKFKFAKAFSFLPPSPVANVSITPTANHTQLYLPFKVLQIVGKELYHNYKLTACFE